MPYKTPLALLFSALFSPLSSALEVITVQGHRSESHAQLTPVPAQRFSVDSSNWLDHVVGAGVNRNGPLSGIAQYRGMFAERVDVSNNGLTLAGAGPNAMDTPLSYASTLVIEDMQIYRGIAPVRAGIDTLGGAIEVNLRQPDLDAPMQLSAQSQFNNNKQGLNAGLILGAGNSEFAWLSYGERHQSDEQRSSGGLIANSDYKRNRYGLLTTLALERGQIHANVHRTDTRQSGTAALPMDIDYVDTWRYELAAEHELSDIELTWGVGYQDGDHGMDNYQQRPLSEQTKARYTHAQSTSISLYAHIRSGAWLWGYDASLSRHDADIKNPNQAMFFVTNFNKVRDRRHSLFAEYKYDRGALSGSFGARVKTNSADSGVVGSSMAMMMPGVAALQQGFNQADKAVDDLTVDLVLNNRYRLHRQIYLDSALAMKQRAPQYQARYLWLPMQSTGGLGDGRTYVGNINLKEETAYQFNLGLVYQSHRLSFKPQVFVQQVDDYIQGIPSQDHQVNMVANMMSSQDALQFSNIDARLYGADMTAVYHLDGHWSLQGMLSYVRGQRQDDIKDNLYRIAPLNGQLSLGFDQGEYGLQAHWRVARAQNKVSRYNDEQKSRGYGVVDMALNYNLSAHWQLHARLDNLFDKQYAPHLNGINRVAEGDIGLGQRLNAAGRTVHLGVAFSL
ncbi:TonB-dependent receptor [Pseudoalteromonas sp. BDTF-M6]|uniref:TonB-dependent receptor domain-containing protein n=1 Tax=Pseudoalteromonas sp. BDTF-M6 TaxID=2796132 RepID=UPI001BB0098B|nr:TonB-dependent receptor [Pseudoalteromonas sp. BDTF-M6]MBS3797781.1 TonB-dependent receptor [Pseudoalteromonas sp. BDTF-M6]